MTPVIPDAPEVGTQVKFAIGENRPLTMRLVREEPIGEVVAKLHVGELI